MSDNPVECSICGRDGQPPAACDLCHGNAKVQSRAFSLSDVRAGRAPKEDRYGAEGGLNPGPSPYVVGGETGHPSHRQ